MNTTVPSSPLTNDFEDADGRHWTLRLSVNAMARVKEHTQVDLVQPFTGDEMSEEDLKKVTDLAELPILLQMQINPVLFSEVLYWLLQPYCDKAEVSRDIFLDSLDGAAIGRAGKVFWPLYADFFQQLGQEPLAQMVATIGEGYRTVMDGMQIDSEAIVGKIQQGVDDFNKTGGKPSGSSPVSSGSTPAHTP
jgi:hypothetical protein